MRGQQQVYDYLAQQGIVFDYYEHPAVFTIEESSHYYRGEGTTMCKNLFFRNHKGNRHYLVSYDCRKSFPIHSLEHMIREGKLSFASPERMSRCLGLRPGSVSPLGLVHDMGLVELGVPVCGVIAKELFPDGHRVKYFIDKDVMEEEKVSFHPCDNTASVVLRTEDLRKFLSVWGGEWEILDIDALSEE
jgi:Ala-tRNA(Pro) deacylase